MYLILNFNRPLTRRQRTGIEEELGMSTTEVFLNASIDMDMPLVPQIDEIIRRVDMPDDRWLEEEILVVLPGMGIAAGVLVAALTARMGTYPLLVRLKKVGQGKQGWWEFAELIDSQAVYQSHFINSEMKAIRWFDEDDIAENN